MKTNWIILSLAMLTAAASCRAANVTGAQAPSAESVRRVVPSVAAAASNADDSTSMREGVISAVNEKRDQVEINGTWLTVVAGKTQLFRKGRNVKLDELEKGQKVRFTLLSGATGRATLGAIYVP